MPDVFVYLTKNKGFSLLDSKQKDLYSYARIPAKNFAKDPKLEWLELRPEPVCGKVTSPELAGILSYKIKIGRNLRKLKEETKKFGLNLNERQASIWETDLPKRPRIRTVRAYIYSCKDLPAADEDGTSDPFLQLFNFAETKEFE